MVIIIISALSLGTAGFLGLNYIRLMAKGSEIMYEEKVLPISKIMQIRINARASDAYTLELLATRDPARNKELNDEITSAWEEINAMIVEIQNERLTKNQQESLDQYKEQVKVLNENRNNVIELASENKKEEAYALYSEEVEPARKLINDTLKELQNSTITSAGTINSQNQETLQTVTVFVLAAIIAALSLLSLLGILIARMIVKPVKEVKNLLLKAENGDFTVKGSYQSKDEIGSFL